MQARIVFTIALFASIFGMQKCKSVDVEQTDRPPIDTTGTTNDTTTYACKGKTTCAEMTSCKEATFYLDHCPGVTIDGDGDGIPCEEQWCRN